MPQMRVLIIDDEPLARQNLKALLAAGEDALVIGEARNGRETIAAIRGQKPDLVFLDVKMPGLDAFAAIEAIGPEQMPPTIFVTAYDRYAVRAFEINAIDYLLKPVSEERFRAALQRARDRIRTVAAHDQAPGIAAALERIADPRRPLTRIAVRSGERTFFVPVNEIDHFEASQNYVRLHVGRTSYLVHVTLSTLEELLNPEQFLRVHRSHIVNLSRVKQLWPSTHGQYIIELNDGQRLESSRTYGDQIRSALFNPF